MEDDEAAERFEWASVLLLGADTVFHDGTLCNKTGTRALAEAAAAQSVPVVVACEVVKLAPIDAADAPALTRRGIRAHPTALVDCVVTEEGTVSPDGIGALVDRTPFLREGATRCCAG